MRCLKGIGASSGTYKGKAKIVIETEDMRKIKWGDVLVTIMTSPDFVPIFGKIGAIVTDTGGFTCHAAVIAREMKIPCVVGTRKATKVLKDNMEVTVDGGKGEVHFE